MSVHNTYICTTGRAGIILPNLPLIKGPLIKGGAWHLDTSENLNDYQLPKINLKSFNPYKTNSCTGFYMILYVSCLVVITKTTHHQALARLKIWHNLPNFND